MEPIEKIKNDMKTLLKDRELLPEYVQKVQNLEHNTNQLNNRVVKVEWENQSLKQKLVRIEDKLLENNLIISGIEDTKFEEEGPHCEKLDIVIAKVQKQMKKSWKRLENWILCQLLSWANIIQSEDALFR